MNTTPEVIALGPMVAPFSQVDPAYAKIPLGVSTTTIGGYGCLLCSLASALYDMEVTIDGRDVDPAMLNRWLARNGGFTAPQSNPAQRNLLAFGAVGKLGAQFVDIVDCSAVPAPIERIARYLADPLYAVLAEVDFVPGGGRQQHWVRLLPEWEGITPEQQLQQIQTDVLIMDPWMPPGSEFRWLMPAYAIPAWADPARAIFRVAIYRDAQVVRETENLEFSTSVNRDVSQQTAHLRVSGAA